MKLFSQFKRIFGRFCCCSNVYGMDEEVEPRYDAVETNDVSKPEKKESKYSVDPHILIAAYNKIMKGNRPWVLFKNGTVVVCPENVGEDDQKLEKEAKEFLAENGKIIAGTPFGDFDPRYTDAHQGFLVAFHTNRIYTFVPKESTGESMDELCLVYGLLGRSLRQADSQELNVIHIHKG